MIVDLESDIKIYLQKQNISFEEKDSQLIADCPFCDKEGHLYIHKDKGLWDCKVCGKKGNWNQFTFQTKSIPNDPFASNTQELGNVITYQQRLKDHPILYDYLTNKRKLSPQVIEEAKIGVNEKGDITIPHYDLEDKLINIKCRYMGEIEGHNKYYYAKQGGQVALYNGKILKENPDQILIVEGELDVLAVKTYGVNKVIGIPGATYRKDDWIAKLKDVKEIFICYDNDEAGQKNAYELAVRLGLDKCKKVQLPVNDLNDLLVAGHTVHDFQHLIESAEPFPVAGISKSDVFTDDVLHELLTPDKLKGYPSGYLRLDKITGGFAEQELRVVSGLTSVGKTTWIMNEFLNYARNGLPVAIFSLESPVKKVMKDMLKTLSDKDPHTMDETEIKALIGKLHDLPIHWFDARNFNQRLTVWKFKELIKNARDRYGIKFVVIDDLQFLINTGDRVKSTADNITALMANLKEITNTLNIHLVVIAHVNRQNEGKMPQLSELKGSSGIEQLADYVMFLHRETDPEADDELKSTVKLAISKNRLTGDTGIIHFYYNVDRCTYEES